MLDLHQATRGAPEGAPQTRLDGSEAALNDDAWPQKVVLIRPNDDPGVRQKITIDLKQMYKEGKADQNFLLEEGDMLAVDFPGRPRERE